MTRPYKILLVDDEEEVRKSIIKKINWEETGFTVVGDAENGEDALEKIDILEPDLVLTDIRMPYMDGLTLSSKIRQTHPSIKIIIFSGYDDFEYAKEAIKLNIIEYILKPVNAEELTQILKKIKSSLDEEIAQIKDTNALKEIFIKNLPILRENFLNDLLHGKINENQIPLLMKEYRLDIDNASLWTVVQVDINNNLQNQQGTETSLVTLSVKRLLDSHLSNCCKFASFYGLSLLYAVIGLDNEAQLSEVITVLNEVCKESKRILDQKITIGIGRTCSNLSELNTCYKQAHEAVSYRVLPNYGDVIYINDVEPVQSIPLNLDSKSEGDLMTAIKFGIKENILQSIDTIIDKLQSNVINDRQYQAYVISILNAILQLIQRYELNTKEIFSDTTDYFEILFHLRDANTLKKWMTEACIKISENINYERQDTTQNMIRAAKKYINDNYSDCELSLEMVCNHLHISTTYFSTVFKREAGESYTSYLTRVRLEKAAELLINTDEKTYVIAKKVGYEESNYFGYVFKKAYGVSPNKYRGK